MRKSTKEILERAVKGKYAVAAANVGNSIEVNAAIEAAEELKAPLILDVHPGNIQPCPKVFCSWIIARCDESFIPLALNLEDGQNYRGALDAITYGAASIAVNRSFLPFWENVAEVKKVADTAHIHGLSVEARLDHTDQNNSPTSLDLVSPEEVLCMIQNTGADCLAARVHAATPDGQIEIDLHRLSLIKDAIGDYPLVLHGALGIPDKQIHEACKAGLNKINLSKDLKIAAMQTVKKGGPETVFDLAKAGIKNKLLELIPLYGSAGKGDY